MADPAIKEATNIFSKMVVALALGNLTLHDEMLDAAKEWLKKYGEI